MGCHAHIAPRHCAAYPANPRDQPEPYSPGLAFGSST